MSRSCFGLVNQSLFSKELVLILIDMMSCRVMGNPDKGFAENDPHVAGVRNNPQNEENFSKQFNKTGCEWG